MVTDASRGVPHMNARARRVSPATEPFQALGTAFGRHYVLHELLGWGAMAQVYRATTRGTGEEVAVKILRPELSGDPTMVGRFLQERLLLTSIADPHVVRMLALVAESEAVAIIMELVRGPNLRTFLADRGTLTPAAATALTAHVLRGLAAVHDQGVVHRDVKPENVLVDMAGPEPVARLGDFGIARLTHGPSLTLLTGLMGTPEYLAPELAGNNDATGAADVYSAGIMLYELLCGVTPFAGGRPASVLKAHLEHLPERIPGVPDGIWMAILSMLAKDPRDRPVARKAAETLEQMLPHLAGAPALPALEEPPHSLPLALPEEKQTLLGCHGERRRSEAGAAPEPVKGQARNRAGFGLLASLGAASVALGLILGIALTRPAAAVEQSFPVSVLNGSLVASRSWRLVGDVLTAKVQLTNAGGKERDLVYDDVIPKSVAISSAALKRIDPRPQVIQADPVLRFSFSRVPPGATRVISYQSRVGGAGPPRQRLARLMADEEKAQSAYSAAHHLGQSRLQTLSAEPSTLNLSIGEKAVIALSGTMSDGTAALSGALSATWSSSRPELASVVSGTVLATAPGTTVVTAAVGNATAPITVSVTQPPNLESPRPRRTEGPASPTPLANRSKAAERPSLALSSSPPPSAPSSSPPPPPPSASPPPPPGPTSPPTYLEQENPHYPSDTFLDHHEVSGKGPRVGAGAQVQVSCKVYDPSVSSVARDGYWYRIASSPWNNAFYAPANNFLNGDPIGGPYSRNTDWAVPDC